MTFKFKLFIVFLVISITPMLIITLVSYNNYSNLIDKQVSIVSANIVDSTMERINNKLSEIQRVTENFIYQQSSQNTVIVDLLRKYKVFTQNGNDYSLFTDTKELKLFCDNLLYTHNYLRGIYIFTAGGNSFGFSSGSDLKLGYRPFEDDWYKNTLRYDGKLFISDAETKSFILPQEQTLTCSRVLFDTDSREFLAVLLVDCRLSIFSDIESGMSSEISGIYLTNKYGKIIYDSSKSNIGKQVPKETFGEISKSEEGNFVDKEGNILTIYKTFPNNDWKLVTNISVKSLKKDFEATRSLMIYITLGSIVVFIFLSNFLSLVFTKPISELSKIMKKNRSNQYIPTKKYLNRSDEIGALYNEFNTMTTEINKHIRESYQNKLISLDSQMKSLEAQINSHFLYNTLESINSIAEIEDVESIAIMSKALGDMFRYSIKTKSELVTLEEELTHVKNYISIQKIRYGEKINVEIKIDENIKKLHILKLILQPLVENAIYHGLENKKGNGNILISASLDSDILNLSVLDNGVGIPTEQMENIRNLLSEEPKFSNLGKRDKQSIGIKNIHSRIQLYYGVQYGLSLDSIEEKGTIITIRVPVKI